jgi:Apea-like HEPN
MEVARRILQCGVHPLAVTAIAEDPIVGPAIASGQLFTGRGGSSGVLEAEVVPLHLIQGALHEMAARGLVLAEDQLIQSAVENLNKLRSGISGDQFDGWMLTAFRGVSLRPDASVSTPWGELVHADRMSTEMWPREGCSAVLATPIRSYLRPQGGNPSSWDSSGLRELSMSTNRNAELTSYGIALGSAVDDPATAVPVSAGELLPTGMSGRSGAFRSVGLHARSSPISPQEALMATEWMELLSELPCDRVGIGLSRLVRGLAERHDRLDSLIDAVIAWENLVGTRTQLSKSVAFGICTLADSTEVTEDQISDIYNARSRVVHGDVPDYARIGELANDALRIGLQAMRSLFENHQDKLEMTSEERVIALGFVPNQSRNRRRAVGND